MYKISLEKGSRKFVCPGCGKKTFKRYFDYEKNSYIDEDSGRCDRENKCAYHKKPNAENKIIYKYFNPIKMNFSYETFKQTLAEVKYSKNTFINNLKEKFCGAELKRIIQHYYLGTTSLGALTIPFINIAGGVRAIQVKQFDKDNKTISTNFLHRIIQNYYLKNNIEEPEWLRHYCKQEKFVDCLFGEHLLNEFPYKPIALVEAPKTAIYGALHYPGYLWLAVYNVSSFSYDKIKVLQGKTIYVFPDLSIGGKTFSEWKSKADKYNGFMHNTLFIFSDYLENIATEKQKEAGLDIADFMPIQKKDLFIDEREFIDNYIAENKAEIIALGSLRISEYEMVEDIAHFLNCNTDYYALRKFFIVYLQSKSISRRLCQ